jgi:hypothetical protein
MSQLVIWAPFVKVNWKGIVADLVKLGSTKDSSRSLGTKILHTS